MRRGARSILTSCLRFFAPHAPPRRAAFAPSRRLAWPPALPWRSLPGRAPRRRAASPCPSEKPQRTPSDRVRAAQRMRGTRAQMTRGWTADGAGGERRPRCLFSPQPVSRLAARKTDGGGPDAVMPGRSEPQSAHFERLSSAIHRPFVPLRVVPGCDALSAAARDPRGDRRSGVGVRRFLAFEVGLQDGSPAGANRALRAAAIAFRFGATSGPRGRREEGTGGSTAGGRAHRNLARGGLRQEERASRRVGKKRVWFFGSLLLTLDRPLHGGRLLSSPFPLLPPAPPLLSSPPLLPLPPSSRPSPAPALLLPFPPRRRRTRSGG